MLQNWLQSELDNGCKHTVGRRLDAKSIMKGLKCEAGVCKKKTERRNRERRTH